MPRCIAGSGANKTKLKQLMMDMFFSSSMDHGNPLFRMLSKVRSTQSPASPQPPHCPLPVCYRANSSRSHVPILASPSPQLLGHILELPGPIPSPGHVAEFQCPFLKLLGRLSESQVVSCNVKGFCNSQPPSGVAGPL